MAQKKGICDGKPPLETLLFSSKALSILSWNSPYFDTFWPIIFEVSSRRTQTTLHLTSRYFKNMWKRAVERRVSNRVRREYEDSLWESTHKSIPKLRLNESPNALWYSWHAILGINFSATQFGALYSLADVISVTRLGLFGMSAVFLSRAGDLTFTFCVEEGTTSDVIYLGCTGERTKALQLLEWYNSEDPSAVIIPGRRCIMEYDPARLKRRGGPNEENDEDDDAEEEDRGSDEGGLKDSNSDNDLNEGEEVPPSEAEGE